VLKFLLLVFNNLLFFIKKELYSYFLALLMSVSSIVCGMFALDFFCLAIEDFGASVTLTDWLAATGIYFGAICLIFLFCIFIISIIFKALYQKQEPQFRVYRICGCKKSIILLIALCENIIIVLPSIIISILFFENTSPWREYNLIAPSESYSWASAVLFAICFFGWNIYFVNNVAKKSPIKIRGKR
jgi:hypothetical protein